ncbi:hypothetical protein [Streptacidiphilus neutrinimicus]|uniref:hypothetical protein n=1 Tax=Streptacidiphilus neutrinimicus TaxID=105420 RepID=UPI0005AB520E|nr:hypothetical protein [Streptacidiphilus neutrinimicus]
MGDIFDRLGGVSQPQPGLSVWGDIPEGYTALPLKDVTGSLERAATLVTELAPDELRQFVEPTAAALNALLLDLADRNAAYCGLGRHLSPGDGEVVTSTLVVAVQSTGAEGDPRQLLGEMAARLDVDGEDEDTEVSLVDLLGVPVLFHETVRDVPTPLDEDESATTAVFTIEALVASEDGSKLAAVEFATPFIAHGPEFRMMMVEFAASLSFDPPPPEPEAGSIRAALG